MVSQAQLSAAGTIPRIMRPIPPGEVFIRHITGAGTPGGSTHGMLLHRVGILPGVGDGDGHLPDGDGGGMHPDGAIPITHHITHHIMLIITAARQQVYARDGQPVHARQDLHMPQAMHAPVLTTEALLLQIPVKPAMAESLAQHAMAIALVQLHALPALRQ